MKRILVSVVLSLALGVYSGDTAAAAEGSVTSTIKRLHYYEGHSGLLVIVNNMSDLGDCHEAYG